MSNKLVLNERLKGSNLSDLTKRGLTPLLDIRHLRNIPQDRQQLTQNHAKRPQTHDYEEFFSQGRGKAEGMRPLKMIPGHLS
jgi:hypothetical protein